MSFEFNKISNVSIETAIGEVKANLSLHGVSAIESAKDLIQRCKDEGDQRSEADIYHIIGVYYYRTEKFKDALEWYEKALSLRQKIKDEKGISLSLNNIGLVNYSIGLWDEAIDYFRQALNIKERLNDPYNIGSTLANLGEVFLRKSKFKEAIQVLYRALDIYEKLNDTSRIAVIYQSIGLAHKLQGDYAYALKMYFKAMDLKRDGDDYLQLIELNNNIGVVYFETDEYSKAEEYYKRSLDISDRHDFKAGMAAGWLNLGQIFLRNNKVKDAINAYKKCIEICKASNNISLLIPATVNLGNSYRHINDLIKSEELLLEALELALRHQYKEEQVKIYEALEELYEEKQELGKAIDCFKRCTSLRNDLFNIENTKAINELKTKYEVEKKEQEAEIHRLKNIELKEALDNLTIEKSRSDGLLLNILPLSIANELKEHGSVKARNFEEVTVMFIDVKNFTNHSISHTPEELVTEIDHCFQLFDDIIDRYPVEKIKTIGDAYLCVSGIPEKVENNAEVMIMAALDMRESILLRNAQKNEKTDLCFDFRFGIHTGSVIAGVVGKKKFEYDIWGDTVNTAARMEQSGEVGKINVSGETYELVKDKFHCTYRGKQEAKNKGMIDMYFVDGRRE